MKYLVLLAVIGCSGTNAGAPVIASFAATPSTIYAGQSTTLSWQATGAASYTIDDGVGEVTGTSYLVSPTATTEYTLTAAQGATRVSATVTVTVLSALPKPVISSFAASPSDVAFNGQSTLSWSVTGATALRLDPGAIDVTGQTSRIVTVGSSDVTYTLTATNQGSSSSTATVSLTVHSPSLRLTYTDPIAPSAKLLLMKNPNSTDSRLVLDLKVGAQAVTAFGFAIDLPLDPTGTSMVQLDSSLSPAGIVINSAVLDPGTGPVTAGAAMLPSTSVLGNLLTIGVARHKQLATDGDVVWPAGSTVFSIALTAGSNAVANTTVWNASTALADKRFRAGAYKKADAAATPTAATSSDVAIGSCLFSL